MLEPMAQWLREEEAFQLIAHVSPDGDTIGSCLALYGILTGMGKRVQVCCDQPMPKIYKFLPWSDVVVLTAEAAPEYKNAISVDCADVLRMGYAGALFSRATQKGNIDHHKTNTVYGDYILKDHTASATGELVYRLWHTLEASPMKNPHVKEIATCLFAAICTDTGSFAYSNTTPDTFRIAASLTECGIDIAAINRAIYRVISYPRMCLRGYVLSNIELYAQGRVSFACILTEDLLRYGATSEDVEGIIDYLRDIDTVEIAILMREARDGTYKVSMRSKQYADVSAITNIFNGGGHLRAAGCTLIGDRQELKQRLVDVAREAL